MTPLGKGLLGKLWFAATMSVVLLTVGLTFLVAGLGAVFFGKFAEYNAFFIFFVVLALVGAVFAVLGGLYLRLWIRIVFIRSDGNSTRVEPLHQRRAMLPVTDSRCPQDEP